MKSGNLKRFIPVFLIAVLLTAVFAVSASALEYKDNGKLRVGLEFGPTSPEVTQFHSADGFRIIAFDETTYESYPLFETAQTDITIRNTGNKGALYLSDGTKIYENDTQAMYITGIGGEIDYEDKTYNEVIKLFFKDGLMRVINIVSFETYLKGVLPREVYASWPAEALKTAAVAARTYAIYSLGGKHEKYGVDICTTTCCQVYGGNGKNEHPATNAAVDETKNQVLAYDGRLAMTVYTATAGDHTESSSGAWGGDQSLHPYLCGVPTPHETPEEYANGSWSNTYSAHEIFTYIDSKSAYSGKLRDGISSIEVEIADNGYARFITVTDYFGNTVTAKNSGNVRGMLSKFVKSAKFTITPHYSEVGKTVAVLTSAGVVNSEAIPYGQTILRGDGTTEVITASTAPVSYTFTGTGWGHGVGMSQNGAMTLAKDGYTYDQILAFYYPGTYITTLSALANGTSMSDAEAVTENTVTETDVPETIIPVMPEEPYVPEENSVDEDYITKIFNESIGGMS